MGNGDMATCLICTCSICVILSICSCVCWRASHATSLWVRAHDGTLLYIVSCVATLSFLFLGLFWIGSHRMRCSVSYSYATRWIVNIMRYIKLGRGTWVPWQEKWLAGLRTLFDKEVFIVAGTDTFKE